MRVASQEVGGHVSTRGWCQVKLIGYSWFRAQRFGGHSAPPLAKINCTKPPTINLVASKEWSRLQKDTPSVMLKNPCEKLVSKDHHGGGVPAPSADARGKSEDESPGGAAVVRTNNNLPLIADILDISILREYSFVFLLHPATHVSLMRGHRTM